MNMPSLLISGGPLLSLLCSVRFLLTVGVFECDFAHRPSVAVLCLQYKIRCNTIHPLYGALLVPHVPVRVTRGALDAHRYTYAPSCCRTSQLSKKIHKHHY